MSSNNKNYPSGSIIVNAQYIKDFSFENPKLPYNRDSEQPAIDIGLDINAHGIQDSSYEVVIGIQIKATIKEETIFIVDLKYAGIFTIDVDDNTNKEITLLVHCPNILFPYARAIISDVTSHGGYPPLMIAPIDFLGLYTKRKQLDDQTSTTTAIN